MDCNLDIYSTIKMQMMSARVAPSDASDEERRRFLSESNCIELLNPANLLVKKYCMDALPDEIPLYIQM